MNPKFNQNALKGEIGNSIAKFILKSAGWECVEFGIEKNIFNMKKILSKKYDYETNVQLMSMPDIVAINPKTRESILFEVKFRADLSYSKDRNILTIPMTYKRIENYKKYWGESKLILLSKTKPFIFIVNISDFDRDKHYRGLAPSNYEVWEITDIYQELKDLFPNIDPTKIEIAKKQIMSIE